MQIKEIKWHSMFAAPRDGQWILLDCDDGSNDGSEDGAPWIPNVLLGRFNPIENYPWEVIEHNGTWNHWAEGRVASWAPLPATGTNPGTPPEEARAAMLAGTKGA